MKRKKDIEELGIFNILLIGENPHAISIADNIHAKFLNGGQDVKNVCNFNIVGDIESTGESKSWFNEFIFDLTTASCFNNVVVSARFREWMKDANRMEKLYMKMLLQAMNFILIDISDDTDTIWFDKDIPQYKFNVERGFLSDAFEWIDGQISKVMPRISTIRLIRSLCGKNLPYLGDVFGCLSGKKYVGIIHADSMRFDVPILFDEFCKLSRGRTLEEIEQSVITRTSSALSVFFK